MKITQLFRCAIGRHHRDRNRVKQEGGGLQSVCVGCGAEMIRNLGGWSLKSDHARLRDNSGEPV